MAEDDPAAEAELAPAATTTRWRDHAVARSLDPARVRAEERVQRFLDAAFELMARAPGKDFTVQEVVEQSGQSLRSFYQYFAGKHELGLALFEESVRTAALQLRDVVADEADPLERLHLVANEYYQLCRPTYRKTGAARGPIPLAAFAQQLLTEHPKEAARAFIPLVSLFEQLLADAVDAGAIRPPIDRRQVAGIALQAIMFNAFSSTISGAPQRPEDPDAGEELWQLLLCGIEAAPPGRR